MDAFRPFETEILRLLVAPVLGDEMLDAVLATGELVSYEHSGVGYFVTVRHPGLPRTRVVIDRPNVFGTLNGVEGGYLVFIEDGELMLECWSTESEFPEFFRDGDVRAFAV
jgi:hypothetical protein